MTIEQRNSIFAKECLTISDVMLLLNLSYDAAARIIREIKRKNDRLHIRGRVHIQDYLDYFGLTSRRYAVEVEENVPTISQAEDEPCQAQISERNTSVEVIRSKFCKDYNAPSAHSSRRLRDIKIYKGGRRNAR